MNNQITLQTMRCPTCGGKLFVDSPNDPVTCPYCENTIIPTGGNTETPNENTSAINPIPGKIRIDGLTTTDSALAYLDILIESYPWEAFSYSDMLSIPELDALSQELIRKSADNFNTWIFCFKTTLIPYCKKFEFMKYRLDEIISEYKNDSPDVFGILEAYTRTAKRLKQHYPELKQKLEKHLAAAEKFGADANEIKKLKDSVPSYSDIEAIPLFDAPEKIPEIYEFRRMRNKEIEQRLFEKGIDVRTEYQNAISAINDNNYLYALSLLYSFEGYLDSEKLIKKISRFFTIDNVLENNGNLFCFVRKSNKAIFSLFRVSDRRIEQKPIINNINTIITTVANLFYYLDKNGKLHAYDLFNNKKLKLEKSPCFSDENIFKAQNGKLYLFSAMRENNNMFSLYELDPITGKIRRLTGNIDNVLYFKDSKLAYTGVVSNDNSTIRTLVFDLATESETIVYDSVVEICGYIDNSVVFMIPSPNNYNYDLYIKEINTASWWRLIEKNVFGFCKIINNKIYYYIGSSKNQILMSIAPDGTDRTEISLCIKNILFCRGEWIYFLRGNAYNTVLCRSKLDGTNRQVIAPQIKEYVDIKNGYLFYINDSNTLYKVLLDGSNCIRLQNRVDSVISITPDCILYTAYDDPASVADQNAPNIQYIKSLYRIDTDGQNCRKLVYNIDEAVEYDDNCIYYTTPAISLVKKVCKLNSYSGITDELLEYHIAVNGCYIATSVYGSYDCPEVWRFRRFRDEKLACSVLGRAFISAYYATSPTLVKWFGKNRIFNSAFRYILDNFNKNLEKKGFEDSPYKDREW